MIKQNFLILYIYKMKNHSKAKTEFEQKLELFRTETQPALTDKNLIELIIYEKLLDIQDKIEELDQKLSSTK